MAVCRCSCHPRSEPTWAAPDVRDPVAAVFACARCLHLHCPALLDGPRVSEPEHPLGSADGYTYDYDPTNDTD